MTDLSEFFSNVEAATQPRGRGKLQPPAYDPAAMPKRAVRGFADALAPNATSLALGEPEAPMQDIPADPGNYKLPPTYDQRIPRAGAEMLSLGLGGAEAAPARAGVGMAANMASKFAPRAVRFAEGAAPSEGNALMRNTVAGAGAAALMPGEAQAEMPQGEDIRQRQIQLKASGDYKGPIDGKWGPKMDEAQNAFNTRKTQSESEDRAIKNAEMQANLQRENARVKETERLTKKQEDDAAAQKKKDDDRDAGMQRLREVETNLSPTSKAMRSYAGPAGYGVGAAVGAATRYGVVKAADKWAGRQARKAEELFMKDGQEVAMKGAPDRVARSNEFARKGGGVEPFEVTPMVNPGYKANPAATPFKDLYKPNKAANVATDIAIPSIFGAEAGAGEIWMKPAAHEELASATLAANSDPSEINIQRLQDAKDNVALYDGISNAGRAGVGGYLGSMLKFKRSPVTPNMAPAEAEKMSLEATLRKLAPKSPKEPKAPKAPRASKAPAESSESFSPPGAPSITTGQPLAVRWPEMRLTK